MTEPTPTPSTRSHQRRALRLPVALRAFAVPNYRRWAAADLVSNVGSWMSTAAVGWLVYQLTGSAAALGSIVAVKQVPGVLFGLLGGAVADRLEARRVLPVTQALHAALAGLLALLVGTGAVEVWHLYAYAVAAGTLAVLDGPCFGRLLAQVLGREHLSNGIALGSVTHSLGWVLGLAAGSVLMAGPGATAVFVIDAVSFAFVAAMLLSMRPGLLHHLERETSGRPRVRDGLAYVRRNRQLLVVFAVVAVTGAFGRHFQVTMAAMADQVFDGGAGLYGRFFTCFSIGALAGAVVAARLRDLRLPVLLAAGAGAALVQATSGASPGPVVFAAGMFAAAACNVVYDTAVSTRVQLLAPGALRGRVLAVQGLVSAVASLTGAPTLGWLADVLGPRAALGLGGGVSLAAVLAGAAVMAGGLFALAPKVKVTLTGRPAPATGD